MITKRLTGPFKSLCLRIGIVITFLHCTTAGYAQRFVLDGNRKKNSITFQLIKNLVIIPVYINGSGPYNFLLDTGVAQMIITDTTFLECLDLKKSSTIKIQGYGLGEEVEAVLTRNITAKVGKSTIQNIPAAIFKKDIFDLSGYLGLKIHGILGYYFFNSFLVKINYFDSSITFYDPEKVVKKKGVKIPIEIKDAKPFIKGTLNIDSVTEKEVELLVDNGSSHPLLLESIDGKAFPLPKRTIPANLGVGINGAVNGSMGRINSLKIGGFNFTNVLAGFPDYSVKRMEHETGDRNGSIGADVLRHFTVTFDYMNGFMYLKKTSDYNGKFDHDMSGMEVYLRQTDKNRFFIGRIEPGSPADIGGFEVNDEILSIDFKDAKFFSLSDLTQLLKERDGKKMVMEVLRSDGRYFMVLELKRRI